MRISDWSSDVCSSDLFTPAARPRKLRPLARAVRPAFGPLAPVSNRSHRTSVSVWRTDARSAKRFAHQRSPILKSRAAGKRMRYGVQPHSGARARSNCLGKIHGFGAATQVAGQAVPGGQGVDEDRKSVV